MMWLTGLCFLVLVLSVVAYTVGGYKYKSLSISGMTLSSIGLVVSVFLLVPAGKQPGLPTLMSELSHIHPLRASNYGTVGGRRR